MESALPRLVHQAGEGCGPAPLWGLPLLARLFNPVVPGRAGRFYASVKSSAGNDPVARRYSVTAWTRACFESGVVPSLL